LRHATPRSLIVLDEVGRGTSTYDGISLAWAIAEELHNIIGAKTLFATHYHELTQLADAPTIIEHGGAVKNFTMAVQERGNAVVFLRQVIEGGAEKSFGIHVAQLAGLPPRVIARAEQVLGGLERERGGATEDERRTTDDERRGTDAERLGHEKREMNESREWETSSDTPAAIRDLPSAISDSPSAIRDTPSAIVRESQALYDARVNAWREVLRELSDADIANMTPVQALVLLNELQGRVNALEGS
jgi:DNA mismatch repair ATPase MutS